VVESYIDELIQQVVISSAVSSLEVIRQEAFEENGYLRLKCLLFDGGLLEFAMYIQVLRSEVHLETYSFHWQGAKGDLIKRWDNVKQHPEIDTYPDHLHISQNSIIRSEPMRLEKILLEIELNQEGREKTE